MRRTLTALAIGLATLPTAAYADNESLTTTHAWFPVEMDGDAHLHNLACSVRANPTQHSVPLVTTATCTINGAGRTVSVPGALAGTVISDIVGDGDVTICVSGAALYVDVHTNAQYLVSSGPQCVVERPL